MYEIDFVDNKMKIKCENYSVGNGFMKIEKPEKEEFEDQPDIIIISMKSVGDLVSIRKLS